MTPEQLLVIAKHIGYSDAFLKGDKVFASALARVDWHSTKLEPDHTRPAFEFNPLTDPKDYRFFLHRFGWMDKANEPPVIVLEQAFSAINKQKI